MFMCLFVLQSRSKMSGLTVCVCLCVSVCLCERESVCVMCLSLFRSRATTQWSSLINAEARSAPRPRSQQFIHTHVEAKWTTVLFGIDCLQRALHRIIYTPSIRHGRYCGRTESMINTERRSWQRKRRKEEGLNVNVFKLYTHVQSGSCQTSSGAF